MFCHGRGRGFESRRPRHSFSKTCVNFGETIEDPKGHGFVLFWVPKPDHKRHLPLQDRDSIFGSKQDESASTRQPYPHESVAIIGESYSARNNMKVVEEPFLPIFSTIARLRTLGYVARFVVF